MQLEYLISSPEEMIELGRTLVRSGYKKFGLIGELGAGKTHFTKGVALGLGLDQDQVHSPTYVYFHEYMLPVTSYQLPVTSYQLPVAALEQETGNRKQEALLHVDMYRMNDSFQIIKIGLEDKMQEYEYWCIERPNPDWINETLSLVTIEIIDNQTRRVRIGEAHPIVI